MSRLGCKCHSLVECPSPVAQVRLFGKVGVAGCPRSNSHRPPVLLRSSPEGEYPYSTYWSVVLVSINFFNCELEGVLGSPESCPSVKTSQEWLATRFILLVVCCKNSDSEPAKRTASEVSIRQITLL